MPALELDGGSLLTENAALLDWIADQSDALRPADALARTRRLDAPEPLPAFRDRMMARGSVRAAMRHEGLLDA